MLASKLYSSKTRTQAKEVFNIVNPWSASGSTIYVGHFGEAGSQNLPPSGGNCGYHHTWYQQFLEEYGKVCPHSTCQGIYGLGQSYAHINA